MDPYPPLLTPVWCSASCPTVPSSSLSDSPGVGGRGVMSLRGVLSPSVLPTGGGILSLDLGLIPFLQLSPPPQPYPASDPNMSGSFFWSLSSGIPWMCIV